MSGRGAGYQGPSILGTITSEDLSSTLIYEVKVEQDLPVVKWRSGSLNNGVHRQRQWC